MGCADSSPGAKDPTWCTVYGSLFFEFRIQCLGVQGSGFRSLRVQVSGCLGFRSMSGMSLPWAWLRKQDAS